MKLHDTRRLTGPNLIWDCPGAVIDVEFERAQADAITATWRSMAGEMLKAVGWSSHRTAVHRFPYGASLALSAPIDVLYAATEVAEWAWDATVATLAGGRMEPLRQAATRLRAVIEEEQNPAWAALDAAAAKAGVTMLSDDDEVSLGLGCRSTTWAMAELPVPATLDWSGFGRVPVGLVTGTNGKTTSVRTAAAIVRAAGLTPGLSCTDWVGVGDEIVERGDYAGPGGARTVLRHPQVEVALLETARGGLLRRGLGVPQADCALITNVSEDHLGDFGSRTVEELLQVKWVVSRAVRAQGQLVLCADDARLLARAAQYDGALVWFSPDPTNRVLKAHAEKGGTAATVIEGMAGFWRDGFWQPLLAVKEIPITLRGAARHNVANALGAAALCASLGIDDEAICEGLRSITDADNPGRCNLFEVDGVSVLVDFAHNLEGMKALFDMARAVPAKRRALVFSQAGDRPSDDIIALGEAAWQVGLERAYTVELEKYARGRARGEVKGLLDRGLHASGAQPSQISHHETEMQALDDALAWAQPGDLIIMLALGEQREVLTRLGGHNG